MHNSDNNLYDPTFPLMTMDILGKVLESSGSPATLGTYLTNEVSELIGARCVILVRHDNDGRRTSHHILGVNPDRRRNFAESAEMRKIYDRALACHEAKILPEEEISTEWPKTAGTDAHVSLSIPLMVNELRIGTLFCLDLPDRLHIDRVLHLLTTLAKVVALVLRNAFLLEQQEHIVEERTKLLMEHQSLFRAIVNCSSDAIYVKDRDGIYLLVNSETERLLDKSAEEIVGKDDTCFFAAEQAEILMADDRRIMASLRPEMFEERVPTSDGYRTYLSVKGPIFDDSGRPTGLFGIARDITERIHLEELYHNILRTTQDGFWICDSSGNISEVNDAYCAMTGHTRAEILSMNISDIDVLDTPEVVAGRMKQIMSYGSAVFQSKHRCRDSNPIDVEITVSYLTSHSCYCVFVRNISERLKLEEQLRQSQKMEAIGQLAGGVAHDFNNILTVISGYSALLEISNKLHEDLKPMVAEIASAVDKASQLTHGLLAFSRKQPLKLEHENLNNIVQHVQKFLARIIGEDIKFNSACCSSELPVMVDKGQIEQVLINLATNARDAMPDGGIFSICTDLAFVDSSFADDGEGEIPSGSYALLTVSDSGTGIDKEHLARIFEPFFTTKEVGKGTGLGMAIIYGIIRQHRGFIKVDSELDTGTTFRIYLPISERTNGVRNAKAVASTPEGGNETILVVEDDPSVRTLVVTVLENFGYNLLLARDGVEAVEVFSSHHDQISLVLMDMIMPKMSGKKAYEEICRIKPGTKVLFSSGYTSDFIESRGISEHGMELIMKPVQPKELLSKIRKMLDTP